MKLFEQTLLVSYPNNVQSEEFKEYAKSGLRKAIFSVDSGNRKEVERRFKYYADYN
jgi:hypothetical protein